MPHPRFKKLAPARRNALLKAAVEEFAAHGYDGASINRIIEASGLSKGSTYYYFDGKADLFLTVLLDASQRLLDRMQHYDLSTPDTADGFWSRFEDMLRDMLQLLLDDPEMSALIRVAATAPVDLHSTDGEAFEQIATVAQRVIVAGRSSGFVRSDLPEDLLVFVTTSTFQGLDAWMLQRWENEADRDLDEMARIGTDMCRRLLTPPPAS